MNMSSQTMRWSDIDMNEGSKIQTLSSSDVEEVSGGWVFLVGIAIRIVASPMARAVVKGAIMGASGYAGYSAAKAIKN